MSQQMSLDIPVTWTIEVEETCKHGKSCKHEGCSGGRFWRAWLGFQPFTGQDAKSRADSAIRILEGTWPTRRFRLRGSA